MMLKDQFLQHLKTGKNYSTHTLTAYGQDLEDFHRFLQSVSEELGINERMEIEGVHFKHIRTWLAFAMEEGLNPRTVARKLATLKSFFAYLIRQQILTHNPAARVKSPKYGKSLPAFVPEKELCKLLDGTPFEDSFEGIRDKCILELLYGCGIRRSELIALQLTDVDLFQQQMTVLGKGNKQRIVPFGKRVSASLSRYLQARKKAGYEEKSSLFLRKTGEPIYPTLVYRITQQYLILIDAPKQKSPHVLRHSYATHLLNAGADLQAIKELLGHSSLAATQVYTHHSLARLKHIHQLAHPRSETDQND